MDGDRPDFLALGPLEVRRAGRPLDLGSRKQRALLAVLLHHAPHPVPVDRLVDELWPEEPPGQPRRSLQVYVSALRRVLGADGELISTVGRSYRLVVPADGFDVARFERGLFDCAAADARGDLDAVLGAADAALALWRGVAWQDLRHLPALAPAAARLDHLRLDLVVRRAGARLALGQHRDIVPELEALVAEHPLREDLRGHLMLALYRSGRQQDALTTYTEGRRQLVEETGLDLGPTLAALHRQVLADDPALRVEDADLRRRRHLPAPATPLVGREEDVAELQALLRGEARLVTLRGPGGVGKTRVALRTAHEVADAFADGVWFVDLAAVTDPALVPQAVIEALQLDDVAPDPVRALARHLAERRVLLVLDNLEQLVEATPFVARLLEVGPGVTVLATSRVPLRAYGEHVRMLDVLGPEAACSLFEDCARRADHRFDLSRPDLVRRLCDALDRLPLAIELVAARAGELTLADMLDQLSRRLDLAADGPRDRTRRQQTLRGASGWSVSLLSTEARTAFARLSVLRGGADRAAVAAVGVAEAELAQLAAASLVSRKIGRVTMLETVREAAAELLEASDEATGVADAHAAYFTGLAHEAVNGLRSPDAAAWTRRLSDDQANFRSALAWLEARAAADRPEGTRMLMLAADLALYWYRTSPASRDVGWLPRALAAAPDASPLLRARAWHGLAICRAEQGRSQEALEASGRATVLFREAGDEAWLARSLNTWGGLHRDLCQPREAVPALEESLALRVRLADPALPTAVTRANLALVRLDLGDLDSARRHLEHCLRDAERSRDRDEAAAAHALLADVEVEAGALESARSHLRTAVDVLSELERDFRLAECLDTLAVLAARVGRPRDAAVLIGAADQALSRDGGTQVPADAALRERRVGPALASLTADDQSRARAEGAAMVLTDALDWAAATLL